MQKIDLLANNPVGNIIMIYNHEHGHSPKTYNRAFLIGISLNIGFVLVEAWFGAIAHSLALLADAGHNLSDVLGLLLAWAASYLVQRPPNRKYTYGLRRTSILAALLNAIQPCLATLTSSSTYRSRL